VRASLQASLLCTLVLSSTWPQAFGQDAPPPPEEAEEEVEAPAAPAGPVIGPNGERIVRMASFNDARIEQVLLVIGGQAGVSITPLGKVPGSRVSLGERDVELETLLDRIARPQGWVWFKQADGNYGVADEAWYKQNELPKQVIQKIFRPDHVKASELERAISPMLTSGISSITADDRTNKLIVMDLPQVIEKIERLIREIDVQLFTRVFYIRHANVADVAEKIESYKSDPGTIEVDETTHQIIVTDLLANIKKMELLIDILDVGPEIVIYDVNNIGLEGEDLEDLQAIIDSIRTEELLFEVNHKQGVFILEDVPEVHDKVEQVLAEFDRPVKQVLIQGEILTTSFVRNFNYGLKRAAYASEPITPDINTETGDDGTGNDTGFGFTPVGALDNFGALSGNVIGGAVIQNQAFLEWEASFNDSNTKVLLQPRLLVRNQESSRIFVGSEEPYLTTFFNDNNNNNGSSRSTSQSTVTDGLTFEITPSISNSYLVELEINVDNDDAERISVQGPDGPQDLIRRDRQSIETVLTIPSGQTRDIGGLISNSRNRGSGGVPFLSKLPVLGALFGTQTSGDERSNLQIFLTPTVVEDIIPRPTGADGKRGRLVTSYDKVAGSYDLNLDQEILEEGDQSMDDLLAPAEANVDGAIESLLRDETPREDEAADADTNWTPKMVGGSGGVLGGGGGAAQRPPQEPVAEHPSRPNRPQQDGNEGGNQGGQGRERPPRPGSGGNNNGGTTVEIPAPSRPGEGTHETRY